MRNTLRIARLLLQVGIHLNRDSRHEVSYIEMHDQRFIYNKYNVITPIRKIT